MKIAHFNPGIRGLASYVINIYDHFTPLGDQHLVFAESKWNRKDIGVFQPHPHLLGGVLPWVTGMKEIDAKLDEFQPDILHHHHPSGRLDFNVDRTKKRLGCPVVTTIHMSVGSKRYFVDWVMHSLFQIDRRGFRTTDCYIAISKFVRQQMIDLGIPEKKIVLLYAGVDSEVFKPLPKPKRDYLEIVFCGQTTPEKGVDLLIRAVHELSKERKVKLRIVGVGTHYERWKKWTKDWPEIEWVGFLSGAAKVAETYALADLVVLPTRWDEAFSYIPIEALSSGTPVLVSATGGNLEAIRDGVTGFHFPQNDWKAIYEILKNADIQRLHDMGAAGREYALAHHTRKLFGEKFGQVYRNLLCDPLKVEQVEENA